MNYNNQENIVNALKELPTDFCVALMEVVQTAVLISTTLEASEQKSDPALVLGLTQLALERYNA